MRAELAAALAVGSIAGAVARGGTAFPRAFAVCNPLMATIAIAAAAAPVPIVAAFVVPAAPNLAHVVVFAIAPADGA